MQITANTTPFLAELFASTDKHARKHCVVVIKATFAVEADGQCWPADEQAPFVYADEHHGDPGTTAIRYESDFAPVKPHAEVLVNAQAVAPGQRPAPMVEVALGLPGRVKKAVVAGDRFWIEGANGPRPTAPEPFTTMPLIWDRAFGGSDDTHAEVARNGSELRNLVGRSFHLNGDKSTFLGKPLPNIERPGSPMRVWSDKPEPIGFGPLGRGWRPRIGFAGTYDQQWMDEVMPFLPADFDDRYHQSAPADQQVASLAPGAGFGCLNMSAGGRFVVRLPEFSVPVRYLFDGRTDDQVVQPDTLTLEPGMSRIILTGRVRTAIPRKMTALREIRVGRPHRPVTLGKPRHKGLAEALAAVGRQRG